MERWQAWVIEMVATWLEAHKRQGRRRGSEVAEEPSRLTGAGGGTPMGSGQAVQNGEMENYVAA